MRDPWDPPETPVTRDPWDPPETTAAAPAAPTERPGVFEQIRTGFGRGVRMGLDNAGSTPGGTVIPSFAQGAVSGGAGLVGGALELAPGAVGRAGAAISRFAQEQGQEAQEREPVAAFAGQLAPAAVPVGGALRAATLGGRVVRGAGVGGAFGAASPTGQEEYADRITDKINPTLLGAALGGAFPIALSGAGSLARSVLGEVEPQVRQRADQARSLGYRLEAGQLRADEPMATGGFGAARAHNQRVSNSIASRAMGEETSALTPEYLRDRLAALGAKYDEIYIGPASATPRTFRLDTAALNAIETIADREANLAAGRAPGAGSLSSNLTERFRGLQRQMPNNRITAMNVTGEELQRLRTEMLRVFREAKDSTDARIAMDVVRAMDDSVARNHPELAARLAELNPQYRTAMTIVKLAPDRGNISPERLGQLLRRIDRNYADGTTRNPLYEMARLGEDLRIRGRGEPTVRSSTQVPLGILERALGVGLRTQPAVRLQQRLEQGPLQTQRTPAALIPVSPSSED